MKPLIFIGLPGSGKSTIGRRIARRLEVDFFDSDLLIERRLGMPIRQFFQESGEVAFRPVEADVIADLMTAPLTGMSSGHAAGGGLNIDRVIATGGGAVLSDTNRSLLRSIGHVIYLHSTVGEIVRRTQHDQRRPLLQVENPEAVIRSLYDTRDPLYRETAHIVLESVAQDAGDLIEQVLHQITRPLGVARG